MKKAVLFCVCGKVCLNTGWKRTTITLPGLLRHLVSKNVTTITFVKMTCTDCFEQEGRGVHGRKE
jgi:hypothetical protein